MSDATVQIKIYPDREMLALDMAEALRSLALFTGIIQGCEFNTTQDGKLTVSSGRLFMRGRVAEVTGGDVPTPTDLTTTQTCYVEAVCDLRGLSSEPMYIKVCTAQEKADLVAIAQNFQDPVNFNASGGLHMLELGTVTVAAGTGSASNFVANPTFGHPHNNIEMLNAEIATINSSISSNVTALNSTINSKESALNTRINNTNAALTSHSNANQAMEAYLTPRLHNKDGHGFKQQVIVYPTVDVPANGTVQVEFEYGYNVTHNVTISGSAMSRSVSGLTGNPYLPTASFSPGTNSYGYPTSLDPRLYAIAINSVRFADAAKGGGKNANNCVIAGFAYDVGSPYKCYVKIRNVGTSAARIDVRVKFLYTTHE